MAEKGPEHIEKYYKLSERKKKLIATTEKHHRNAYDAAVDALLTDEKGEVDIDKLKDMDLRDKFADKITEFYVTKAKQALNIGKKDMDVMDKDMLLHAYAGATGTAIKNTVRKAGKNYTFDAHYGSMKNIIKEHISPRLQASIQSHFKQEHVGDIVKYTKSGDFIDTKNMRIEEAVPLLEEYKEAGSVSPKVHEDEIYYKKHKKK